jgi:hypothetical protein
MATGVYWQMGGQADHSARWRLPLPAIGRHLGRTPTHKILLERTILLLDGMKARLEPQSA